MILQDSSKWGLCCKILQDGCYLARSCKSELILQNLARVRLSYKILLLIKINRFSQFSFPKKYSMWLKGQSENWCLALIYEQSCCSDFRNKTNEIFFARGDFFNLQTYLIFNEPFWQFHIYLKSIVVLRSFFNDLRSIFVFFAFFIIFRNLIEKYCFELNFI